MLIRLCRLSLFFVMKREKTIWLDSLEGVFPLLWLGKRELFIAISEGKVDYSQ